MLGCISQERGLAKRGFGTAQWVVTRLGQRHVQRTQNDSPRIERKAPPGIAGHPQAACEVSCSGPAGLAELVPLLATFLTWCPHYQALNDRAGNLQPIASSRSNQRCLAGAVGR